MKDISVKINSRKVNKKKTATFSFGTRERFLGGRLVSFVVEAGTFLVISNKSFFLLLFGIFLCLPSSSVLYHLRYTTWPEAIVSMRTTMVLNNHGPNICLMVLHTPASVSSLCPP